MAKPNLLAGPGSVAGKYVLCLYSVHDTNHHVVPWSIYATADSTVSAWLGLISAVQHTLPWYRGFTYILKITKAKLWFPLNDIHQLQRIMCLRPHTQQ